MKLHSMNGKPVTLPPSHPNLGVTSEYRRTIRRLFDRLTAETVTVVTAEWGEHGKQTQDSDRMTMLQLMLLKLKRLWEREFEVIATVEVPKMMSQVKHTVDLSLRSGLTRAGFAIKFEPSKAQTEALEACVLAFVDGIRGIPAGAISRVDYAVWDGVMKGFDAKAISDGLQETLGIARRRADALAAEQVRRAHGAFNRARSIEAGITKGIWKHSHASRDPRPEHVEADGTVFDLREGLIIDGHAHWPGSEWGCNCFFKPLITPPVD